MKKLKIYKLVFFLVLFLMSNLIGQDFTVDIEHTTLNDTLGSEIVFETKVVNISSEVLTLAFVREINDLPVGWGSSLCFTSCYAPFIDSIVTNSDFNSKPLIPGDTIDFSIHVNALTTPGTGKVQMKIFNLNNPTDFVMLDLIATTIVTSIEQDKNKPDEFYLSQNYPNPFNPTTTIRFSLANPGNVTLKIYNLLGEKVASLVNEHKSEGIYEVNFNPGTINGGLASGAYIYRLNSNTFSANKKLMILK